jgi:Fe-S cluster assembly iron-binding protein IscA
VLTLTPNAEEAVRQLVANATISEETGGLRIAPGQPTPEGVPLELSLVGSPEPDDLDAGAPDVNVYLERSTKDLLDDKVLDARVEGESVGFALLDAPETTPSDNGTAVT